MTDDLKTPSQEPMEDGILDRYLAALPRFAPRPGFEDRVMARVRIAPEHVPAARPRVPAVRRRRWAVVAGTLTGAAAVSSTALTAWLATNFVSITATIAATVAAWALPAWQAALTFVSTGLASAGSNLAALLLGGAARSALWIASLWTVVMPLSVIGLYLATRPPLRKPSYVAR